MKKALGILLTVLCSSHAVADGLEHNRGQSRFK